MVPESLSLPESPCHLERPHLSSRAPPFVISSVVERSLHSLRSCVPPVASEQSSSAVEMTMRKGADELHRLPLFLQPHARGCSQCRRKSTLFISASGTRKVPYFQAFQRTRSLLGVNLHFMTCKPGLYPEQSVTLRRTLKYSIIHLFNYDKNIPSPRNPLLLKLYIL